MPRLGRLGDGIDRLTRAVVAGAREVAGELCPQLVDGLFVADDHSRPSARRSLGEATAGETGWDDIGPDVTESRQPVVLGEGREAAQSPPGDILEKHTLDGILGAEVEDLLQTRVDRL